jgi:SAM-dependent methyltransferase
VTIACLNWNSLEAASICPGIRQESFSKAIPYDQELATMVAGSPSHTFLVNAASQNTYLYQVEFIRSLCESHFRRSLPELALLDWGCGKGHVSFLLKRLGAQVTSCDYCSAETQDEDSAFGQDVPIIRDAAIAVDRLVDATQIPYAAESFDGVLSFGVLEHVTDDVSSLKEIRRILRPGGLFFCFNLPYFLSWTQRLIRLAGHPYHERLYSKSLTQSLLDRTGFGLADIWHRQLFPKNKVRYPFYRAFESADQFLTNRTPLKYFATNIEFVAVAR